MLRFLSPCWRSNEGNISHHGSRPYPGSNRGLARSSHIPMPEIGCANTKTCLPRNKIVRCRMIRGLIAYRLGGSRSFGNACRIFQVFRHSANFVSSTGWTPGSI